MVAEEGPTVEQQARRTRKKQNQEPHPHKPGRCSLGDIFIEAARGHYQGGSTGKLEYEWIEEKGDGGKGGRRQLVGT
jgi:hypothetical protein